MRNKAYSAHVVVGLFAGLVATTFVTVPAFAADPPAKKAGFAKAGAAKANAAKADSGSAGTDGTPAAKPPTKKQKDAARKAYGEGEKAFNSGDYAAAVVAFHKANDAIKSPQADYWIAKALDAQNKTDEAIAAYESFLAEPESVKVGDQKLSDAKARLDALKATLVAEVAFDTDPPGSSVSVDGTPQEGQPPLTLKLTPGKHRITVTAAGYQPKDVDLEVKGGDQLKQAVALVKEAPPPVPAVAPPQPAAPPPAPPPPPEPQSMVPAYVTLGIAGASAIVGTIFGVKALGSKSDFDKNPTTKSADDTERSALIADMAFGVAITLGVTGVVLLTSDDDTPAASPPAASLKHHSTQKARLDILPYAGPKSGGAQAKLTF